MKDKLRFRAYKFVEDLDEMIPIMIRDKKAREHARVLMDSEDVETTKQLMIMALSRIVSNALVCSILLGKEASYDVLDKLVKQVKAHGDYSEEG